MSAPVDRPGTDQAGVAAPVDGCPHCMAAGQPATAVTGTIRHHHATYRCRGCGTEWTVTYHDSAVAS